MLVLNIPLTLGVSYIIFNKYLSYTDVVKTITKLTEFADLIVDVDNRRRLLELREGINQAKAKHLTFRTMCGPTYASVFGIK